MKRFVSVACAVFLPVVCPGAWQDDYGVLLKKYVSPAGVRYREWKANGGDVAAMQRVVEAIDNEKASDLGFYLNAYNAWILHEALTKYPTKSVKDPLFSFFLANRIRVRGEKMSFNHLEKDIIRARFKEPRVHFALNCASRSCPPLLPEPFRARTLDAQLHTLAQDFVNSDRGVRMSGQQVRLSKIFDWYKADFGGESGELSFINRHRKQPLPANPQISFDDYDWSLNEAK